jgi:drug/metabolite transporter (DMT)-like permease
LCGQLIVSETLFALVYAFLVYGDWPTVLQWLASAIFILGMVSSIRAHR